MHQNMCSFYNSKEAASGSVTDKDITTISGFENLFKSPHSIGTSLRTIIRSDAAITYRLNKVGNDTITLAANGEHEIDWMGVSAIFITAGSSANLKVIVAR